MKFVDRLFEPVDAASLVFFRVAFGVLMTVEFIRYLALGWVKSHWMEPLFLFKYYGFEWVQPWPGYGMYIHVGILVVASLLITVGWFYRIAATVFFFGFTYLFLLDQAQYLNHFYFISLIGAILILLPANRNASIDAWLRPELRSETVPRWSVSLLRFQMGVVYVFGGFAKLNPDWLHGQPLTMWLQNTQHIPEFMHQPAVGMAMSWAGMLFDLFIVPLLLWDRTRIPAFVSVLLFHLTNAYIFDIGIFPWFSIAATLMFFPPDWKPFKLLTDRLMLDPVEDAWGGLSRRLVVGVLSVWVAFQVLMPLRHFAYPGLVHWNEEGHRFAWHMKLRSKDATGALFVRLNDGTQFKADHREHLTRRQSGYMRTRPDLLLQYAHWLADHYADRGVEGVYAHVFITLNGRPLTRFVDPEVDLSEQPRTLGHVDWIIPWEETDAAQEFPIAPVDDD